MFGSSGDIAGHRVHAGGARSIFAKRGDGLPGITADADLRVDFNFAEEGDVEGLGEARAFAVAEDVNALFAMRAGEVAHVFDDAEDFDVDLAEHFDGLADVGEGHDGRRSDQDCAVDGSGLDQGKLDVAGARREVDDEVVEVPPEDAAEELLHDAVEHRAAPDEGLVARIEEAHGDHFYAVGFDGNDGAVFEGLGLLGGTEHERDVGAVDVGVEETDG